MFAIVKHASLLHQGKSWSMEMTILMICLTLTFRYLSIGDGGLSSTLKTFFLRRRRGQVSWTVFPASLSSLGQTL